MKLSRALLIVLLLHVVAVSGIIAFNAIKTRESSFVPAAAGKCGKQSDRDSAASNHADASKRRSAVAQKENAPREDAKPSHSPSKSSAKDDATAQSRKAPQLSARVFGKNLYRGEGR